MADLEPTELSLEIIKRLIGFDTTSSKSNLELIDWVESYLLNYGIRSRLTFSTDRTKANLFATVGTADSGGIILAGHTDTVPVIGQNWIRPPFEATTEAGRVYGRGTADMKSFIAVCLAMVPEIIRIPQKRPIHLALTFDEETTMLGAKTLVADLRDQGLRPFACLIGEPTELKAIIGHKGRRALRCCVRGQSAHSSIPTAGVNSIEYASRIIAHLESMAQRHLRHEHRHYGYDVPYSTIVTTQIGGGISSNTVPPECSFSFEFRHLPWTDPDKLEAEVRAFATQLTEVMPSNTSECSITFETESVSPAFGTTSSGEGLPLGTSRLLDLMGKRGAPLGHMAFATEASWFEAAGISTVVCGPGSIDQAHKPDEFIELSQIAQCEQLLKQLIAAEN